MKNAFKIFSLLISIVLIASFIVEIKLGHTVSINSSIIKLNNGNIEIVFSSVNGELLSFKDLISKEDLIEDNLFGKNLWKIFLEDDSASYEINSTLAQNFVFTYNNDSTSISLIWDKFGFELFNNLSVKAEVTVPPFSYVSYWHLTISGIDNFKVDKVIYPITDNLKTSKQQKLAVPVWMGQLLNNPVHRLSELERSKRYFEWHYPGNLSFQCMALYEEYKIGFYTASTDTLNYRKSFSVVLNDFDNLSISVTHYPPFEFGLESYSLPYNIVLGCFKGDWLTAAEIYRDWAVNQYWCHQSRLLNNNIPEWVLNTAAWIWNRGWSKDVKPAAISFKENLGLPVSLFWHWWHGCSYDDGFPEYLPPRDGEFTFKNSVDSLLAYSINPIVYMNQVLWGMNTVSWKEEEAEQFSAKNKDGKVISHVFNTFTGTPLAYMCMTTPFWRNKYSSLADDVINNYNVSGVYMDMACTSVMCYDSSHNHSIGGGNYWVRNFGKLTEDIRSKTSSKPNVSLAGEGCGEAWLPYVDLFLTLQVSRERYVDFSDGWEPIPFFQAVYHDYVITYGNYSSLTIPPYDDLWPKEFAPLHPGSLLDKKYKKQFFFEHARALVWGMQPTIANFNHSLIETRREEIDYFFNLAKFRYDHLNYFQYGEFVRAPKIEFPFIEVDFSRLSIYAGRKGGVTSFPKQIPAAISGAWKSKEGTIGICVVSVIDYKLPLSFAIDANEYKIEKSGSIFLIDKSTRKKLSRYSDGLINVSTNLPPKSAIIIEILPD